MNPTIADAKKALGLDKNADLARFLGVARQALTGRGEDDPMPDAWCWRAAHKRPDLFLPATGTPQADGDQVTKRALIQRLALGSDTSLAVLLQLPREVVEGWSDETVVPDSLRLRALLSESLPPLADVAPADPEAGRIVPVETA